jgi:hypothetical protein
VPIGGGQGEHVKAAALMHAMAAHPELPVTLLVRCYANNAFERHKEMFGALDVAGNLTGVEVPKFAYDEKSMPELKKSLKQVIKYLKSITPEDVKKYERGLAGKRIPVFFDLKQTLLPKDYVHNFALPNFFFHYVTAYDILRHYGVPIGKKDYLGPLSLPK